MEALSDTVIPTNDNSFASNSHVPPDIEYRIAFTMMSFVMFFGFIGNSLVISVISIKNSSLNFCRNRYRRQQQRDSETDPSEIGAFGRDNTLDFFVLVLAISDLIVCIIIIPSTIAIETIKYRMSSVFLCKLYYVFFVGSSTFSSLLISAVALDRYLFICHSLKHILTLNRAKILVSCLAGISLILGIAVSFMVALKPDKENVDISVCDEIQFMNISTAVYVITNVIKYFNHGCFILSILAVLILYTAVFRAIVVTKSTTKKLTVSVTTANKSNGKESTHDGLTTSEKRNSQKRGSKMSSKFFQKAQMSLQNLRSALMLFIIAIVYIVTFLPVFSTIYTQGNLILYYLYFINSATNPCIYAIFTPSFRRNIVATFRSPCCSKKKRGQTLISARSSRQSESFSTIFPKSNQVRSHQNGKRREDDFPFITREQRRAAAAAAEASSQKKTELIVASETVDDGTKTDASTV